MAWLAIAWLAAAVATAVVFHRARRVWRPVTPPPATRVFLQALLEALRAGHPAFESRGMLPGRFVAVLELHGQQFMLPLHDLFRTFEADAAALAPALARALDELVRDGLSRVDDHPFAEVVDSILPQVRTEAWVRGHAPSFGDAALVQRPLGADLRLCYVIDDGPCMVFVTLAHLRAWGADEPALFRIATGNLRARGGAELPAPQSGDRPVLVQTGDGYDAARVVLLDPERAEGLLVAVPERDSLWLGRAEAGPGMETLMRMSREHSETASYPVSPALYRMHAGRLEAVNRPT
jgi:uncharacterized protein YtpQ (UPF0354 family)